MSPIFILSTAMFLLLIGINLAANNTLHSYIINYIFYDDQMSNRILRLLGFCVLGSVLLLVLDLLFYAVSINIFVVIIFIFLSIRGRAKAQKIKNQKIAEAKKAYDEELEEKRQQIEKIKERQKDGHQKEKDKPQSVQEIKDKLWDDGSMTNKELIDNFKNE